MPLRVQRHSVGLHLFLHLRHLSLLHGLFVVCGGLALDDFDRTGRTLRQAVAHAVAVVVLDEFCLAAHHRNRTLMAGVRAQPASVALRLVNLDNLSFHVFCLRFLLTVRIISKPACEIC